MVLGLITFNGYKDLHLNSKKISLKRKNIKYFDEKGDIRIEEQTFF